MPSYAAGILVQGNCPALVKGGVFSSQKGCFFAWDKSGLIEIREAVRKEAQTGGFSSTKAFLALAAKAASSFETADDWLLPPGCLDTSPENVWYHPLDKQVLFCFDEKAGEKAFMQEGGTSALFALLLQLAALEAPEVYPYVSKLSERAEAEHLSFAAIKKELSRRLTGPG